MSVIKDEQFRTYSYLSRYSSIPTYYNDLDKKRYYGTAKQLSKDIGSYKVYTVQINDNLDSIALKYYNNPLYWWVIADINSIQDPMNLEVGKELKIPSLSDVKFE